MEDEPGKERCSNQQEEEEAHPEPWCAGKQEQAPGRRSDVR